MTVERFPIEASHVMMFARAVGDPDPAYADEDAARERGFPGILAPPTFAQAAAQFDPEYHLRPRIGQPWMGSGRTPTGLEQPAPGGAGGRGGRGLHAEQEFVYHRPLQVGDVLRGETRPGETWEKQGRSGKLVFTGRITEYRDPDGELVVTARSVGVRTERPVTDAASAGEA
jgi:hypothetical protein